MRAVFDDRNLARMMWLVLGISVALLIGLTVVFYTGNIQFILPLVIRLSGTQESAAVAYSWCMAIGLLSAWGLIVSGLFLIIKTVLKKI